MQAPSASDLLRSWERGLSLPLHERALLLVQAACPEITTANLAQLSVGRRDALLLQLRKALFGSKFASQAVCPYCGEQLELAFDVDSILMGEPELCANQLSFRVDGYDVAFRLPNSLDLRAVMAEPDVSARHRLLLQRCISCSSDGKDFSAADLPVEIAEQVEMHMAELDPQANVEIDVSCPGCRGRWSAPFQIAAFLWAEVNAWALRVLQEVHLLARHYGWSEREIVGMHPAKRQLYLKMVCG